MTKYFVIAAIALGLIGCGEKLPFEVLTYDQYMAAAKKGDTPIIEQVHALGRWCSQNGERTQLPDCQFILTNGDTFTAHYKVFYLEQDKPIDNLEKVLTDYFGGFNQDQQHIFAQAQSRRLFKKIAEDAKKY